MKAAFLIIAALIPASVAAQQVHLMGSVTDAGTNQPIAGATLSIINKNLFYPTDDNGKFDVVSDKISLSDTVYFSCVGFRTQKIKAADLAFNSVVKLSLMVNTLNEVKIKDKAQKMVSVGSTANFTGGTAGLKPGSEVAMFMAGSDAAKGYIKSVGFFVSNGHSVAKGGDAIAPFRIKLYSVNVDKIPGKELTKDVIIVNAKKNETWFDVDLSAYHIENPANGFFVSFCLLDSGYYKIREGYKFKDRGGNYINWASPRLATNQIKQGECHSYDGHNDTYFGFEWKKDMWNDDYLIRATIAPE